MTIQGFSRRNGATSAFALIFSTAIACAQPAAIQWSRDALSPAVEVVGAPREILASLWAFDSTDSAWPQVFAVFAEQGHDHAPDALPPMAGTWRVMEGHLR